MLCKRIGTTHFFCHQYPLQLSLYKLCEVTKYQQMSGSHIEFMIISCLKQKVDKLAFSQSHTQANCVIEIILLILTLGCKLLEYTCHNSINWRSCKTFNL